jgi:flagellar hook-associated protein 1 FlgK
MGIPTTTGLNAALSGLEAAQAAIDTTGENISNASTPGYTEQVVNTTESAEQSIPGASNTGTVLLGTGVDISSISRIRDQFLDIQYRAQNAASNSANTTSTELQQVQAAVNEPSTDGISSALSAFWQSWGALTSNPAGQSNAAAVQGVISAGQTLVQTVNSVYAQMSIVQTQAAQQYSTLTGANGQVQQDATKIANLNQEISAASGSGQTDNALLDQRDNAIDDLSSLGQVSIITNQTNGSVTVNFGDAAKALVGGTTGTTVTWPQTLGGSENGPGGQLGALLQLMPPPPSGQGSPTGPITTMMSSLDTVASKVINAVNNAPGGLPAASPFFNTGNPNPDGSTTDIIDIATDPPMTTAALQSLTSGASGAAISAAIAGQQNGTADQSYAAFVAQVGGSVQSAQSTQSTAQSLLTAIGNQRESVSGVSLDQEMTNLTNYQQAYEASARVMNAMDSVISTLITTVGGAGI